MYGHTHSFDALNYPRFNFFLVCCQNATTGETAQGFVFGQNLDQRAESKTADDDGGNSDTKPSEPQPSTGYSCNPRAYCGKLLKYTDRTGVRGFCRFKIDSKWVHTAMLKCALYENVL